MTEMFRPLLRNSRKTRCGARPLLIPLAVRAAPFALLRNSASQRSLTRPDLRESPIDGGPESAPCALRVLFVIPGEDHGNSMIFARRLAHSLARTSVEVECFYLRSRTSPTILTREFFRLRGHIARFQPALVHAQFGTMTAMLAALAAGRRPLAITYRGGDLNPSPPAHTRSSEELAQNGGRREAVPDSSGGARRTLCASVELARTTERPYQARSAEPARVSSGLEGRAVRASMARLLSQLAALRAPLIVCVSEGLRQRLWWGRNRAVVLPSGVDTEQFQPEARDAARARLGWPPDERVVLFNAGRDPGNKRLDLAVAAAAVARRSWPNLRLEILYGEADPSRVAALMNASDCLLVASDAEGSPSVIQEALACAVPILSVDVGDAAERLRGVTNTGIVERDAESIGRALAEITAVPLRTNGPEAVGELSFDCIARRLGDLYRGTLGGALPSGSKDLQPGSEKRIRAAVLREP